MIAAAVILCAAVAAEGLVIMTLLAVKLFGEKSEGVKKEAGSEEAEKKNDDWEKQYADAMNAIQGYTVDTARRAVTGYGGEEEE